MVENKDSKKEDMPKIAKIMLGLLAAGAVGFCGYLVGEPKGEEVAIAELKQSFKEQRVYNRDTDVSSFSIEYGNYIKTGSMSYLVSEGLNELKKRKSDKDLIFLFNVTTPMLDFLDGSYKETGRVPFSKIAQVGRFYLDVKHYLPDKVALSTDAEANSDDLDFNTPFIIFNKQYGNFDESLDGQLYSYVDYFTENNEELEFQEGYTYYTTLKGIYELMQDSDIYSSALSSIEAVLEDEDYKKQYGGKTSSYGFIYSNKNMNLNAGNDNIYLPNTATINYK